jgi:hypothetical protein
MLPIRNKSIFKSRWIALVWAGGIIWTAVDFAGGRPQGDANGNAPAVSNDDIAATQTVMNALDSAGK